MKKTLKRFRKSFTAFTMTLKRIWRGFTAFTMTLNRRIERSAGATLLISVGIIVALVAQRAHKYLTAEGDEPVKFLSDDAGMTVFLALLIFVALFSIITLYTRTLDREIIFDLDRKDPDESINILFRVSYAFVAAVVLFTLAVLIEPKFFATSGIDVTRTDGRTQRILAVVRGCDYSPPGSRPEEDADAESRQDTAGEADEAARTAELQKRRAAMPEGANCGDIPPQWVLSIGGNVLNCHIDGTCAPIARPKKTEHESDVDMGSDGPPSDSDCPDKAKACGDPKKALGAEMDKRNKLAAGINSRQNSLRNLELLERAQAKTEPGMRDRFVKEISDLRAQLETSEQRIRDLGEIVERRENRKPEITRSTQGQPIVGGLVVPVYFLAIAVLGACVGMVRRLPELHRRVTEKYWQEFDPQVSGTNETVTPIEKTEARDRLVFQGVQVVFAPVVAILAYSFARPDDVAAAAILAFAAGYSSEIFLMLLRGLADRLIGVGLRPVRTVSAFLSSQDRLERKYLGTRVMLKQPLGTFGPGSLGVITGIKDGRFIVRAEKDERGVQRTQSFKPKSLDFFRLLDPLD